MKAISRRRFIQFAGFSAGAVFGSGLVACARSPQKPQAAPKVVIVGGGFGGATTAKYIRKLDSNIDVVLVEPKRNYTTCPGSNWVLGGLRNLDSIRFSYESLTSKYGIQVVHDEVQSIDPQAQRAYLKVGKFLEYDRLVLSPGIDFRWDAIAGYDADVAEEIPHAWKAGPQTALLRKQLESMPDGGTFVIAPPPNPFRCPPGPYERVSMVAHYLKHNKPRSKLIILDAKSKFSKQGLFTQGWRDLYDYGTNNSLIEWIPAPNGTVIAVNAKRRIVVAGDLEEEYQADVLNVIPPQKAGHIAMATGLTDESGWCPVRPLTFESRMQPKIHVIGDACIAAPIPKSGYAANSQAKVCAAAVVDLLNEREPGTPSWVNTCYSLVGPSYGISVAMVYELGPDGTVTKAPGAGGLTPDDGNRSLEAVYAESWYANITHDSFG